MVPAHAAAPSPQDPHPASFVCSAGPVNWDSPALRLKQLKTLDTRRTHCRHAVPSLPKRGALCLRDGARAGSATLRATCPGLRARRLPLGAGVGERRLRSAACGMRALSSPPLGIHGPKAALTQQRGSCSNIPPWPRPEGSASRRHFLSTAVVPPKPPPHRALTVRSLGLLVVPRGRLGRP